MTRWSSEHGEAADDAAVVAEAAVAVQFDELREDVLDVVPDERAVLVAGDLDGLPRGQVLVELRDPVVPFLAQRLLSCGASLASRTLRV